MVSVLESDRDLAMAIRIAAKADHQCSLELSDIWFLLGFEGRFPHGSYTKDMLEY